MRRQSPIHYAWVIALSAMLVVLCAVGLARFAFGMVLPTMARDLALNLEVTVHDRRQDKSVDLPSIK